MRFPWIVLLASGFYLSGPLCAFAAPDLFVEKSKPSRAFLRAGHRALFSITVKNQGDATSSATTARVRIDENADGSWEHSASQSLIALPPQDSDDVKWPGVWTITSGLHRFELCIDPDALSGDGDTSNNCIHRDFAVPLNPKTQYSDVVIQGFLISPPPTNGALLTFTGLIRNYGRTRVDFAQATLSIDGAAPVAMDVAGISGTKKVRWEEFWTATPGSHTYLICSTSFTQFETDYTNNCMQGTFIVPNY
jgi:hypothetical protein